MPKISGEIFQDGDFYLTAREKEMLSMVKERFDDIVVVLNIGGIMDLSWVKNDDRISSALLGWQGRHGRRTCHGGASHRQRKSFR